MALFDLIHFAKNIPEQHTMRDISILHDLLKNQCPNLHQKRLSSLMVAVQSLLDGQQLSLTELGRNTTGAVAAKHNIKRIDRLLGNRALHNERFDIYRWHARLLCGTNPMPIILIDWSDVREQMRHQTLRASVSFEGRSVILYERVFPFSQYNSPVSHNPFLRELAAILPERCCPLIVTDAGYRNTWFREVEKLDWFWLGRVRGELGRKSPINACLHLFKAKSKGRKDQRSSKAGRHHNAQQNYRDSSKEPWLLATNIPAESLSSKKLVNLYAKRMQIEESFRDIKSPQYGLGLRHSRTRRPKRFDMLLLIAMLAEWLLRLIGMIAHKHNWQYAFQANTVRNRPVLSLIRLGREVRKRRRDYPVSITEIRWAITQYIRRLPVTGVPEL